MAVRTAQVEWTGDFRNGRGKMAPGSKAFTVDYSYDSIVGDGPGSNPVEMLACAVAGCVSSTLAAALATGGYTPKRMHTHAHAHLEQVNGSHSVTRIELHTAAEVGGIDGPTFQQYAERITRCCPVGKAISSVELIVSTELL